MAALINLINSSFGNSKLFFEFPENLDPINKKGKSMSS